jgi:hypothetical protein
VNQIVGHAAAKRSEHGRRSVTPLHRQGSSVDGHDDHEDGLRSARLPVLGHVLWDLVGTLSVSMLSGGATNSEGALPRLLL